MDVIKRGWEKWLSDFACVNVCVCVCHCVHVCMHSVKMWVGRECWATYGSQFNWLTLACLPTGINSAEWVRQPHTKLAAGAHAHMHAHTHAHWGQWQVNGGWICLFFVLHSVLFSLCQLLKVSLYRQVDEIIFKAAGWRQHSSVLYTLQQLNVISHWACYKKNKA